MKPERKRKLRRQALIGGGIAALLVALAAGLWRFTDLAAYAEPKVIADWIRALARSPWMPLFVALIYLVGNSVMLPNTLLNAAVILALGTGWGIAYALGGSLAAGSVHFLLGRRYGQERLRALDIEQLDTILHKLDRSGLPGMVLLRNLPIAPYGVVNVMCGAAGLRFWVFFLGTLIGLLPGSLAVTAFGHQLERLIADPDPHEIVFLVGIVAAALGVLFLMRRVAENWLGRPDPEPAPS